METPSVFSCDRSEFTPCFGLGFGGFQALSCRGQMGNTQRHAAPFGPWLEARGIAPCERRTMADVPWDHDVPDKGEGNEANLEGFFGDFLSLQGNQLGDGFCPGRFISRSQGFLCRGKNRKIASELRAVREANSAPEESRLFRLFLGFTRDPKTSQRKARRAPSDSCPKKTPLTRKNQHGKP